MTSDVNLNMQGQHSGNGATGSNSKKEQTKRKGDGDVKMMWNGLGEQNGRRDQV